MNKESLRLLVDISYYVTSEGNILITEPDKKIFARQAGSYLRKQNQHLVISGVLKNNNGFQVKCDNGHLMISHPDIINGRFLGLLRSNRENLVDILSVKDIKDQVFEGTFELATTFDDYTNPEIYVVCQEMPEYQNAWEGFVNRVNTTLKKKTKVLTLGHRYLTADGLQFVYVGTSEEPVNIDDYSGPFTTYQVFVRGLLRDAGTISEYLKKITTRQVSDKLPKYLYGDSINTTLYMVKKPGLMVDLGEFLEDDLGVKNLVDFWGDFIKNNSTTTDKSTFGESIRMANVSSITNIIYSTIGSDNMIKYEVEYKSVLLPEIEKIIKSIFLNDIIINYMGRDMYDDSLKLKSKNSVQKNIEVVKKLFSYLDNSDGNLSSDLIEKLGVDITKLAKEALLEYSRLDFSSDFDTFYKYHYRLLNDRKYQKTLSISTDEFLVSDEGKFREQFKSSVVADKYIEMLELAKENLGLVSEFFDYFNIYQYRGDVVPDINLKIGLTNIVDYLGGVDNISEEFKELLLSEEMVTFDINFKRTVQFK